MLYALSWSILNVTLDYGDYVEQFPILQVVDIIDSAALFPVLFYLFVVHQIEHPQKDSKYIKWLFLPFAISLVTSALDWLSFGPVSDILPDLWKVLFATIDFLVQSSSLFLVLPVTLVYTYVLVHNAPQNRQRTWLRNLSLFLLVFSVGYIVALLVGISASITSETSILKTMTITMVLILSTFIYWVAYSGIYKLRLAQDQEGIKNLLRNASTSEEISGDQLAAQESNDECKVVNAYFAKLEHLCAEEHIYRDNDLDRDKVAQLLGVSAGYVSQIVKDGSGVNFSTYINQYRIEEVKRHIVDEAFDQYSLLAIGYESGFSSKTTFHNTFKKITGMTPNAYRKEHK